MTGTDDLVKSETSSNGQVSSTKVSIRSTVLGGEPISTYGAYPLTAAQNFVIPFYGSKIRWQVYVDGSTAGLFAWTPPESEGTFGDKDARGVEVDPFNPYDNGGEPNYPGFEAPNDYARCAYEQLPVSCSLKEKMEAWDNVVARTISDANSRKQSQKSRTTLVHDSMRNSPQAQTTRQTQKLAAGPDGGAAVHPASMPTAECPPGRTCNVDEEGREYYIDEDGTTVYPNSESGPHTRAFDLFDIKSPRRSPTAGFMGPMPPGLSPGLQPPVTMPESGAGPGWGRVVFTRAVVPLARTVGVALIAPTAVILMTPTTANAPTGQTTTTTTTTDEDNDPFVGVYRVAGGSSEPDGEWWTPVDPTTIPNYRGAAALPPTNTGELLVIGSVRNSNIIHRGIAAPQPQWGHQGGAIEYRVIRGSVIIHGMLPLVPRL